jgi:hypothetical protein
MGQFFFGFLLQKWITFKPLGIYKKVKKVCPFKLLTLLISLILQGEGREKLFILRRKTEWHSLVRIA